jgi:hypothetical protein
MCLTDSGVLRVKKRFRNTGLEEGKDARMGQSKYGHEHSAKAQKNNTASSFVC